MAFDRTNFAWNDTAQGSGAPKCASYRTSDDNKAAVKASGYFNGLAGKLEVGDFIMVNASDGSLLAAVAGNTGTVVTVISIALA